MLPEALRTRPGLPEALRTRPVLPEALRTRPALPEGQLRPEEARTHHPQAAPLPEEARTRHPQAAPLPEEARTHHRPGVPPEVRIRRCLAYEEALSCRPLKSRTRGPAPPASTPDSRERGRHQKQR